MGNGEHAAWASVLKGDPIPWLLEERNPCVRYRTLTELLERPVDDAEVCSTVEAVWDYPPAASLLTALAEVEPFPPGTVWGQKLFKRERGDLDTLYRFGIPPGHPVIREACERWLDVEITPDAELPQANSRWAEPLRGSQRSASSG